MTESEIKTMVEIEILRDDIATIEAMEAVDRELEERVHRTPEFLFDCEACAGQGYIARTVHVYEAGCGFSHPDVEETPCQACNGVGWFVCESEGD